MISRHFLVVCASLVVFSLFAALTQGQHLRIPRTRFSCVGRPSGYYADMETDCQVYHMCDGLGRQFSYTCPNTTLFQQRMLICDHWYMVNCSKSEQDYDANLLIGQRDKPFVSDAEMQLRTPRPDILSVPPNNNYYDGLKAAESKYPVHPGNSITGVADSISDNEDLDSAKNQYRPPTSWSTGTNNQRPTTTNQQTNPTSPTFSNQYTNPTRPTTNNQYTNPTQNYPSTYQNTNGPTNVDFQDNIAGAASQKPTPTFQTVPENTGFTQTGQPRPSPDLVPPFKPSTSENPSSEEYDLDARMKNDDKVIKFINRFDPNSPDSHNTAMSQSEIHNINQQLPQGQDVSTEDERTGRKQNTASNFNTLQTEKSKGFTEQTRFNSVNVKQTSPTPKFESTNPDLVRTNGIKEPERILLPPKTEFTKHESTTMGPPIYYEWKWAAPAFDLEPPRENNETRNTEIPQARNAQSPFRTATTTTTEEPDLIGTNVEYNISSYYVPDYLFPLDKAHPGYDNQDAQTSFQVNVARRDRSSYGENPACPQCHPVYLEPGKCQPCIIKR